MALGPATPGDRRCLETPPMSKGGGARDHGRLGWERGGGAAGRRAARATASASVGAGAGPRPAWAARRAALEHGCVEAPALQQRGQRVVSPNAGGSKSAFTCGDAAVRARASGFFVLRRVLARGLDRLPARSATVLVATARRRVHLTLQTTGEGLVRTARLEVSRISPNKRRAKARIAARAVEVVARLSPACAPQRCLKSTAETTYASGDNPSGRSAAVTAPGLADSPWRNRHAEGYKRPLRHQGG